MTPHEWGEVGLGGACSALITAVGAYFVKRADHVPPPPPEMVSKAEIETVTRGLGELIDDLQHERRENRHTIRNLRMELDGLRQKLEKADLANARVGRELVRLRTVLEQCEALLVSHGLPVPGPIGSENFL